MAALSPDLLQALLALEQAAAAAGRLLPAELSAEDQLLVTSAFGAPRPFGARADRWSAAWCGWLRECAERLPCDTCLISPESNRDLDTSGPLLRTQHRDTGDAASR